MHNVMREAWPPRCIPGVLFFVHGCGRTIDTSHLYELCSVLLSLPDRGNTVLRAVVDACTKADNGCDKVRR